MSELPVARPMTMLLVPVPVDTAVGVVTQNVVVPAEMPEVMPRTMAIAKAVRSRPPRVPETMFGPGPAAMLGPMVARALILERYLLNFVVVCFMYQGAYNRQTHHPSYKVLQIPAAGISARDLRDSEEKACGSECGCECLAHDHSFQGVGGPEWRPVMD